MTKEINSNQVSSTNFRFKAIIKRCTLQSIKSNAFYVTFGFITCTIETPGLLRRTDVRRLMSFVPTPRYEAGPRNNIQRVPVLSMKTRRGRMTIRDR